jgi:hypothetical protein
MEKKKVTIAGPMVIAGITLILVIKLSINSQPAGNSLVFSGVKQPVSLVVASPASKKALALDGGEIPINKLLREASGLADMLESN